MRFIGLDLLRKLRVVCVLDRKGNVLFRELVECRREAVFAFSKAKVQRSDHLAVEATTNRWSVADILRPFVAAVTVGNPLQFKAFARPKVKSYKIDAEVLDGACLRRTSGPVADAPAGNSPWGCDFTALGDISRFKDSATPQAILG